MSENPRLILASASSRRREILQAAGIKFEAIPAAIPEQPRQGESVSGFVCRIAAEKAKVVYAGLAEPGEKLVLGADTVGVIGEKMLGKPDSPEEARQMLRWLSGKEHQVMTGLCLLCPPVARDAEPQMDTRLATTAVKFCELTDEEINEYIATGEPFDKAGGYAIQGQACQFVEWIRGCYFNVVGLPVALLYQMLKRCEIAGGNDALLPWKERTS
ncbi:MAG: septum formation protein Maf [Acidobacteria bacterium]|nr:septum formation protein Maf [Acidobacteriota bacterium]